MKSQHEHDTKRNGFQGVVQVATIGVAVAAVVKECRTPAAEREWNGTVAGFVPYDFRVPTLARFKERVWAPQSEKLVSPQVFGVGWTVNVGRVVELVRQKREAAKVEAAS